MFRFVALAILMAGVMVVIAGPITRTCTETTNSNGEITETCHVVGQSGNNHINRTEITIRPPGSIYINRPGFRNEVGVRHIAYGNNVVPDFDFDFDRHISSKKSLFEYIMSKMNH